MGEVAEVIIAVEEAGGEATQVKDEVVHTAAERERSLRRKIFWIWANTWINRSLLSLLEVGRVSILSYVVGFCLSWRRHQIETLANSFYVVTGTLKGYDALMNLVLDDVSEVLRGMDCFQASLY